MRFLSRFFALSPDRAVVSRKGSSPKTRSARVEALERRELLALSATSADFQTLLDDSSINGSDDAAIWVSSLEDGTNAKDGEITLREALDYAGQTVDGKTIASTIRFKIGGTIQLSSSLQSLKILSKSLSIDASDVGGITIQAAKNSLAFYIFGGSVASNVDVSITNATVIGNVATSATESSPSKGGAIQLSAYCDLTLDRCDVRNANSASVLGGAVYVAGGSLTLLDSNLSENVGIGDASKGGAVYVESGILTATRTKFADNSSASGGAVYVKSGDAEFNACRFDSNEAFADGGALYVNSGSVALTNVGLTRNKSGESGGAIVAVGNANCILEEAQFVENSAVVGGALHFGGEYLDVEKSVFLNNESQTQGGALYVDVNSYANVGDSSFRENSASKGGAFYNLGQTIVSNARFELNDAKESGGAICSPGYVEARDSEFDANEAENTGGALYVDKDAQVWLLRVDVKNSKASEGAGVYNAGALNVVDSSLTSNVAIRNGGAVSNSGELYASTSTIADNRTLSANGAGAGFLNYYDATIRIANSTIANNVAASGSGGAVANNGTVAIVGALITSNVADSGGAVYNGGTVVIRDSTLYGNKATNGGGCYGSYGSATTFENSSLRRNVASNNGGALYCFGAASVEGTTIAENAAITAESAPYYSPINSSGAVVVDKNSKIVDNFAVSSFVEKNAEPNVVIADVETSEIVDGIYFFGNFAATSASTSKSFTISNVGDTQLNFSQFESSGDSAFSYELATSRGATLDCRAFALAPNETVLLTITFKPQKVGSKYDELNWIVSKSAEVDAKETSVSLPLTALTSKTASVSAKIVSPQEESGATISFNSDGSLAVSLSKAPTENVVVYLHTSKGLTLSTDVLLFTPSDYNVAQTVAVSLDAESFRNCEPETSFVVTPEIITTDETWNVAAIPAVTFQADDYVVLRGKNAIDLNEYAANGVSRWDLDDDGDVDATTNGVDPCFVPADSFTKETVVRYQTQNGKTTMSLFDVVAIDDLPSVSVNLSYVKGAKGGVQLEAATDSSVATRWRVDWGDGSPYAEYDSLSTSAFFAHCYKNDGRYVVSVELLDVEGRRSGWNVVGEAEISGISAVQAAFAQVDELLEEREAQERLETIAVNVAPVKVVDVFATLKDSLKEETSGIYEN